MNFRKATTLWLGANVVVTTILTGMLFVPDVPYLQALWIVFLGSLVGVVGIALVGNIGTRTGLPTMVASRGAALPSVVNLAILIGWSWVQALLAGLSVDYAVNATFGYSNVALFTIICEVIVVLIVLRGHVGIERMEFWVAVSMLVLSALVFYKLFSEFSVSDLVALRVESRNGITAAFAFDIVIATAFSWMSTAADFNRNATSQVGGMAGTAIGYVAATMLAMGLGATVSGFSILSGAEQTYDPTVLLAGFGFGLPAAAVIFLSVMTTNVMAVHSAVMSYLNVRPQEGFWKPALVIGLVTIVGALWTGILDQFQTFLLLIAGLFVPVFAIILADYWILKRGQYSVEDILNRRGGRYWYTVGFNVPAWISCLVGIGAAFYWLRVSPLSIGASIPTFLLTLVLYLSLSSLARRLSSRWTGTDESSPAPVSGIEG
jgi:putative hydroxymethylpyrimidine transporter CytX